ncbi:MAG: hypothetical protein N2561_08880 [Bacteroidetes bacterium]|nr:hypothetical protein [Bacteroidota bacterium]
MGAGDLTPHLRFFPQRFRLETGQSQTLRFLARLPAEAGAGVYWTRLEVRGTPPPKPLARLEEGEIQAQIVGSQNVIIYLRRGSVEARPELEAAEAWAQGDASYLRLRLRTAASVPAIGTLRCRLRDGAGVSVAEAREYVPIYGPLTRLYRFSLRQLPPGSYTLRVRSRTTRP